ncbi:MAG: metallophosphoesterase [Pyrinomonadaceae bacterium]
MCRTIVIGDIHGCFDELSDLLEKVALTADDRVVAVGDLTVKGPKSKEVLDLFAGNANLSSVIGNHDLALVKRWRGEDVSLKKTQKRARKQLKKAGGDFYFRFLESLPFFIDLGDHVVVHAGLRPGVPLREQTEEDLTELRTLGPDPTSREGVPWYEEYSGPKTALFGHWPSSSPRKTHCAIGLDTGCVYGSSLTAYIIETDQFVSIKAREAYDSR